MKHFHVAVASRDGMILNEKRYADAHNSVSAFLGLACGIFQDRAGASRVAITETALLEYADIPESACIYLDYGSPIRLYWISCMECKPLPINN